LSKTRAKTVAAALALASSCLALPQPEALAGPIMGYRVEVGPKGAPPIALYAEESGSGTPVVLLHGLGESTFTWRKIIPALAASHRVVALDLKGFGRSEKPLDQAYSADDQAALVAAFLDKRGLTGVTLVGHSFGGTVALRTALALAAHDPSRIARLVVISAPAFPHAVAPYLDLVETPAVPEALVAPMPPEALARILLSESRGGGEVPDEDVKGYAAPYYDLAAKHAFLVTARSIVTDADNTIRARYRTLRQPSLVIWCRNDPIVPLAAGRRLTRALPNARLAVLKGCHHLPQDERPDALLAQLKPFLAR
jgi:pimeloyl-ACP methyl ester carboxylesterase